MQKGLAVFFLSIPLLFFAALGVAEEDPLRPIRQLSDEVYRLSQEMVAHGADGHTEEVADHGRKMAEATQKLIEAVQASPSPQLKSSKTKIIVSLKSALKRAEEGTRLAEEGKAIPALEAARKASFQAKRVRQRIQTVR